MSDLSRIFYYNSSFSDLDDEKFLSFPRFFLFFFFHFFRVSSFFLVFRQKTEAFWSEAPSSNFDDGIVVEY